eukprot:PITA_14546
MCIDYRALDKITFKKKYPLPRIDDLLDQLKQAKYFTKLDLKSGYHQVQVKEEHTWKITFKTKQESKIYPSNMEAIMKWPVPTNVIEVRSFIGASQYLRKLIVSFLAVAAPLHAITTSGKSLQWGKGQQKAFNELKKKINEAPVLALPNLQ